MSEINEINEVKKTYNDYLVTCPTGEIATRIFQQFQDIVRKSDEFDSCIYPERSITLSNGDRYRFISDLYKDKYIRGFRGKVISSSEFEIMMNIFKKK